MFPQCLRGSQMSYKTFLRKIPKNIFPHFFDVCTRGGNCSPGSGRLQRLGVSKAQKAKLREMSAGSYARHSVCPKLLYKLVPQAPFVSWRNSFLALTFEDEQFGDIAPQTDPSPFNSRLSFKIASIVVTEWNYSSGQVVVRCSANRFQTGTIWKRWNTWKRKSWVHEKNFRNFYTEKCMTRCEMLGNFRSMIKMSWFSKNFRNNWQPATFSGTRHESITKWFPQMILMTGWVLGRQCP